MERQGAKMAENDTWSIRSEAKNAIEIERQLLV